MYNTLQKVRQALESVNNMTPEKYAELDNDAWQLVQDVRDCCKAIADRVDVLELLQPIPERTISDNGAYPLDAGAPLVDM